MTDATTQRAATHTTTSYVVLGLVRECQPTTAYEIKRLADASVGYFWDFPRSQLYVEADRLVAAGLLAESRERDGRRRRVLEVTAAGEAALASWIDDASGSPTQIRDLGLLKLFFAGAVDAAAVVALAERNLDAHRSRLAEYEAIAPGVSNRAQRATLEMGIRFERTCLRFWEEVRDAPPI